MNRFITFFILGVFASNTIAYDWQVETTVRLVQPTYMPILASFQVNNDAGACQAGAWLRWDAKGATEFEKQSNVNAVYSTLVAALMSEKKITIYGSNSNCTVEYLHMY